MTKTLEQKRAADSLAKIDRIMTIESRGEEWKDKYASYVESLPAAILNCGLGQAAATLLAASKKQNKRFEDDPHYVLYMHVQDWLCRNSDEAPYNGTDNLLKAITAGDRGSYMLAQAEALKWLEWHKKLAVAYLKKQKAGE